MSELSALAPQDVLQFLAPGLAPTGGGASVMRHRPRCCAIMPSRYVEGAQCSSDVKVWVRRLGFFLISNQSGG
jgi:hypothetical protein